MDKEKVEKERRSRYRNRTATDKDISYAMDTLSRQYNKLTESDKETLRMAYDEKNSQNGIHPMRANSVCDMYLKYIVGY